MDKKNHGLLKSAFVVLFAGVVLFSGCQKISRYEKPQKNDGQEESAARTLRVVLRTEESKAEEVPTSVSEELPKKPLPVLVSTSANATQVALAYEFEPGEVLEKPVIEEIGEDAFFVQMMIDDEIFSRMENKSYKADCPLPLEDLRYLRVLHCDLSGESHIGELVCNKSISDDLLAIFYKLYKANYPIEKMILIDEYENADIMLSSADNNTAAFNYRNTVGKTTKSLHAQGIAIDINPLYNPYVMNHEDGTYEVAPANGEPYMDRSRTDIPYKIDESDLCYQLFTEAGFTWGGIWNSPDYMHFFRK